MKGHNYVYIMGNLAADPEIKNTQNGKSYANFRVAVNKRIKRNGEWKDSTTFVPVKMWGDVQCDYLSANARKGSPVSVIGEFTVEEYGREGERKYFTCVSVSNFDGTRVEVLHRSASDDGDGYQGRSRSSGGRSEQGYRENYSQKPDAPPADDDFGDSIPF